MLYIATSVIICGWKHEQQ